MTQKHEVWQKLRENFLPVSWISPGHCGSCFNADWRWDHHYNIMSLDANECTIVWPMTLATATSIYRINHQEIIYNLMQCPISESIHSFFSAYHYHLLPSGRDGCWGDFYFTKTLSIILSLFAVRRLSLSTLWGGNFFLLYAGCESFVPRVQHPQPSGGSLCCEPSGLQEGLAGQCTAIWHLLRYSLTTRIAPLGLAGAMGCILGVCQAYQVPCWTPRLFATQ